MKIAKLLFLLLSIIILKINSQNCFAPANYKPLDQTSEICLSFSTAKIKDYPLNPPISEVQKNCLSVHYRDINGKNEASTSNCKRKNRFDEIYSYASMSLDTLEDDNYLNSAKFGGSVTEISGEYKYSDSSTANGFIAATNAPLGDYTKVMNEFKKINRDNLFNEVEVDCGDYGGDGCFSGNFKESDGKFRKDNTMLAFYRALQRHKINYIIQLTNFVEQPKAPAPSPNPTPSPCKCKVKADRYFADAENAEIILDKPDYTPSNAKVKTISVDKTKYKETEIRKLEFTDDNGTKHSVDHIHFRAWLDFNVPQGEYQDELMKIIRFIKKEKDEGKNIIVHCTGGIGRTGTFISSVLTTGLKEGIKFDLANFILQLREKRPEFVETDTQVDLIMRNINETKVQAKKLLKKKFNKNIK